MLELLASPAVVWAIWGAVSVAIAWFFREIFKPWSDAKLQEARDFHQLIETLKTLLPQIGTCITELKKHAEASNESLQENNATNLEVAASNRESVIATNNLIEAFGSDPKGLCKLAKAMQAEGIDDKTIARWIKNNASKETMPAG